MSKLIDLKRKFFSAMPVIGPHSDIEAELLIFGDKPIGWITNIPIDDLRKNTDPKIVKNVLDKAKLDQAVMDGVLKTICIPLSKKPDHRSLVSIYCKPEYEDLMNQFAMSWRQQVVNPENILHKKSLMRERFWDIGNAIDCYGMQ